MDTYTIKEELKTHIEVGIFTLWSSFSEFDENDLHNELFNVDYYIIGNYKAEQWLKKHNISVFQGIRFVQDYERKNFGDDAIQNYDNAETLVNMIVFIIGEELIYQEEYHKECRKLKA